MRTPVLAAKNQNAGTKFCTYRVRATLTVTSLRTGGLRQWHMGGGEVAGRREWVGGRRMVYKKKLSATMAEAGQSLSMMPPLPPAQQLSASTSDLTREPEPVRECMMMPETE